MTPLYKLHLISKSFKHLKPLDLMVFKKDKTFFAYYGLYRSAQQAEQAAKRLARTGVTIDITVV